MSISADVINQIDELCKAVFKDGEPGATVLVAKDGEAVFRKGYGMANMELGVENEPHMVFRLGSITKQFTAVAILMLAEQGKLDLQDDIHKYLPDYPTHGHIITIEHLLTHVSGIMNYTAMESWMGLVRNDYTVEEMIDIFKNEPMEFVPGTDWNYNNSAYFMLGAVIEKVTGVTYEEYLQKNIFDVLEMKDTYYDSTPRIIPGRVAGYQPGGDGFVNSDYISLSQPYAAGSLASSVDDMLKWDSALYTEKLLSQEWLQKAWEPYTLQNGASTGYGYGWAIFDFSGMRVIEHSGGIPGFITNGIRMPEEKIYVVILTNRGTMFPDMLSFKLGSLVAGKPYVEPTPVDISAEVMDNLQGVYQIIRPTAEIAIFQKDGKLISQTPMNPEAVLIPLSESEFAIEDSAYRLTTVVEDGKITGVKLHGKYGLPMVAKRTDKPLPTERKTVELAADVLENYVGKYEVAPGVAADVTLEEAALMVQIPGQPKLKLNAETETQFFIMEAPVTLEFQKEDGQVNAVMINQAGQEMLAKKK